MSDATTTVLPGLLAPPPVVDAPQIAPPLHSLLTTALEVPEASENVDGMDVERWVAGFTFQPEACDQGGVWVPCVDVKPENLNPDGEGSGSGAQLKSEFDAEEPKVQVPFVVEGQFTCGTKGFQVAEYPRRARRNLENIQVKQIEHEAWTGVQMAQNPTGAQNMSFVSEVAGTPQVLNTFSGNDPVAVSPRTALALAQQGIANCATGPRGTIHATAYLTGLWAQARMLDRKATGS